VRMFFFNEKGERIGDVVEWQVYRRDNVSIKMFVKITKELVQRVGNAVGKPAEQVRAWGIYNNINPADSLGGSPLLMGKLGSYLKLRRVNEKMQLLKLGL